MEAFLTSTFIVALAEIGDKTQLLAILLATRFNRPLAIIAGIFAATIANHVVAAYLGAEAAAILDGAWFDYLVAASFIAMAGWTLIPDKLDEEAPEPSRYGAFLTTLVTFFLVEIGDKTQVATVALAARYQEVLLVTAGTTIGMLLANVPAVIAGRKIMNYVPINIIRMITAGLFLIIGLWVLAQASGLVDRLF